MPRDPRYDVLFEPVKIGPVTAKNRFYQVPHCTGMGHAMPRSLAAMREVKAEGGWGVVCTEYCSIHPSSEDTPYAFASLWDEDDVKNQALMCEAVHRHGALAGVELWHGGERPTNRYSRLPPMAPSATPPHYANPVHSYAMDKSDIRAVRRWQVAAAKRAQRAGFDIVYVYMGHGFLPLQFIARRFNRRLDEYGGSLENRVRLAREMIEDTKEAVGDACAVAVRFSIDELMGAHGVTSETEGREVIEMLAELPDLWDVQVGDTGAKDSASARFEEEGWQERYTGLVKSLTSKPVVGVGRFTSPDTMASQVRRGVLDFIGAARPSIADPFLPSKIEEGRIDEIRECIGCNICRSANNEGVPLRCTQNPTMGEEWRRGWHPERIETKGSDSRVLVVGAGPAGLECARALGQRGYSVTLAEAGTALGGRVTREAALPGLASWARVRDWRAGRIAEMANVEVYFDSRLGAADILEFGFEHVVVASGATWRRDGIGTFNRIAFAGADQAGIYTPDDIMAGAEPEGPVVVYDDDHYYMGGVIAEKLRRTGREVALATPATDASTWTHMTSEQHWIQARLIELGVEVVVTRRLTAFDGEKAELACVYTDRPTTLACASLVVVGARDPNDALYHDLVADAGALAAAGIASVTRIGDCLAPATIAHAVYAGHRYAREFDAPPAGDVPFRRERVVVGAGGR
ncbi:MAG: FAD-dependent oxidoreductase [Alphaproteobacteria bacterium]